MPTSMKENNKKDNKNFQASFGFLNESFTLNKIDDLENILEEFE